MARALVRTTGIALLIVGFVLLAVNDPGLPYGERTVGLEMLPIGCGILCLMAAVLWPQRQ